MTHNAQRIGARMADGSVFAGMTADGKSQIYAMPGDLDVTMTFNDAAKAVNALNSQNALGHDDWQIPALKNVSVLYKSQNEGALKGTFNTSGNTGRGSESPGWYWSYTEVCDDPNDTPGWLWSSMEGRDDPNEVHSVRFSDGLESWCLKDGYRLSCRPVRLVEASR